MGQDLPLSLKESRPPRQTLQLVQPKRVKGQQQLQQLIGRPRKGQWSFRHKRRIECLQQWILKYEGHGQKTDNGKKEKEGNPPLAMPAAVKPRKESPPTRATGASTAPPAAKRPTPTILAAVDGASTQ